MIKEKLLDPYQNPILKYSMNSVGISTPPQLRRSRGSWQEDHLHDRCILVGGRGTLHQYLAPAIQLMGCDTILDPQIDIAPYEKVEHQAIKAYSELDTEGTALDGAVFDATHFAKLSDLDELFEFFKAVLEHSGKYAKFVIINRLPKDQVEIERRAAATAVEGFAKSIAKELGRRTSCLNVLNVGNGEEAKRRVGPACEFYLSDHASFITGQIIDITATARGFSASILAGSLAGRTVLVTGAAQGIGLSISQAMASEGAHVLVLDRAETHDELQSIAKSLEGIAIARTLGAKDSAKDIANDIQEKHGYIDVIVHNAGILRDRSLRKMKRKHWDQVLDINLRSVFEITQEILSRNLIKDGGRIICMSSISGIAGNFGQSNYSCSKAGMRGLIESWAYELASQGITANAVAPGFIDTAMTRSMPMVAQQVAKRLSTLSQSGIPQDVADAVCFLASPCSQGINGQVLRVCGGHLMGA